MPHQQYRAKITNADTVHAATDGRVVKQVLIVCTTAGQTIKIIEPSAGLTLIPVFSPTVPTDGHAFKEEYECPVRMHGIDIVTTATGTCSVWIDFGENG